MHVPEWLIQYIVPFLWFMVCSVIALAWLCRGDIRSAFLKVKKSSWIMLVLVFLLGLILRLFVFPHQHLMYIDEPWYLEMAANINEKNMPVVCEYTDVNLENCYLAPKPYGWPFIISLVFRVFGTSSWTAIYLNSVLGGLSVVAIFMFVFLLLKDSRPALFSSLLLALFPVHVLWSSTAEANVASGFFILVACCSFLLFLHKPAARLLFLASAAVLWACLMRYENVLLVPLFLAWYWFFKKKHGHLPVAFLLIACVVLLQYFGFRFVRSVPFSPELYLLNLASMLAASTLYGALLCLAIFLAFWKGISSDAMLLWSAYLVFVIAYLPFFSEDRLAITPAIFIIALAGCSFAVIRKKYFRFVVLALVLCVAAALLARAYHDLVAMNGKQVLETVAVNHMARIVPKDCYVVSEWPTVVNSVLRTRGIRTSRFLSQESFHSLVNSSCVYFFYDGYCERPTISASRDSWDACRKISEAYLMTRVVWWQAEFGSYSLHRIDSAVS